MCEFICFILVNYFILVWVDKKFTILFKVFNIKYIKKTQQQQQISEITGS